MEYSFMHKIVVPNTILIVDDDEMNRDVLGNIFSASHSIEMAENGKECLNKILECGQKFCAVLLDVVMPVMGCIEVLKKLNRDGVVDHILRILCNAGLIPLLNCLRHVNDSPVWWASKRISF